MKNNFNLIKQIMGNSTLPKWHKWILVSLVCYWSNLNTIETKIPFNQCVFRSTYNLRPEVFNRGMNEFQRKGYIDWDNINNVLELKFIVAYYGRNQDEPW